MQGEQVRAAELFAKHECALITFSSFDVVACLLIEDCQFDERSYRVGVIGAVDRFANPLRPLEQLFRSGVIMKRDQQPAELRQHSGDQHVIGTEGGFSNGQSPVEQWFCRNRIARQRPLDAEVDEARRQVLMCGALHSLPDRHGALGELSSPRSSPSTNVVGATEQVEDVGDFGRVAAPGAFDPSQQRPRDVLGFDASAPIEELGDLLQRSCESRDRRGGLDAGCLCGRSGRMATDQRGIDDEQSTQEGDERAKRGTLETRLVAFVAGVGHQFNLTPSWISRGGLVLVIRPNPPDPDVPHTVAADEHVVDTSRNCVWLNTLIISPLNWR